MGKVMAGGASFALIMLFLCFASAPPSCSAAFDRKQQQFLPESVSKDWSPSSRLPEPPSIDIGQRSSAVFPLYGNVYPDGLYYVALSIGDPPKPYFLDVDTGSDLTWIQCDAPCVSCSKGPHPLYRPTRDKLVPCEHPICASLQAATASPTRPRDARKPRCDFPTDQCDYEVEYADQGSSRGVLVNDLFSIRLVNGSLVRPRLAFGCGYDQQLYGADATSPTDGVLGLGVGRSSVMWQLREKGLTRNVMGHCLGRKGGGFLFFGEDLVPPSGITWTPMSRRGPRKYYSPGPANLFLGRQLLGRDVEVIFDSGSSYTYLSSRPYEILLHMMTKDLASKPLKEAPEDLTLPLCWRGAKPFRSIADSRKYFKPLVFGFPQGNKAFLDIPPEGYLILTRLGNLCLGILNGTEVGLRELNIIGDISFQDLSVVYDNEREQIGWARANCDKLPLLNADGNLASGAHSCRPPQFAGLTEVIIKQQCPATQKSAAPEDPYIPPCKYVFSVRPSVPRSLARGPQP